MRVAVRQTLVPMAVRMQLAPIPARLMLMLVVRVVYVRMAVLLSVRAHAHAHGARPRAVLGWKDDALAALATDSAEGGKTKADEDDRAGLGDERQGPVSS